MPQTDMQRSHRGGARAQPPKVPPTSTQAALETEDHVYGLVSVLYHALQGAETYERYIDDAERADDDELVRFFEQCRDQENDRATRAKHLLVDRVNGGIEDEDDGSGEDDENEAR
ncbi:MAG TPA: hypothetical protein VGP93_03270 [Polyangiaceae bacterium]|jgi:hypothetical protein|nr:hypothetical protein [Polyangiaceae bacterium]